MILLLFKLSIISYVVYALMQPEEVFVFYGNLLIKLPLWLAKPLGYCYKCFAGQVCLWGYLIVYYNSYKLLDHMFFVSAGIFMSLIYNKIWQYLEK